MLQSVPGIEICLDLCTHYHKRNNEIKTLCKWREIFNQLRDNKQHIVASHRKTFKSIHGDKKHILTN